MSFPERIICLTEESTELLYLLGEEDRIVGISAYTVRPDRAKKEKPKVSAFIKGNLKKIQSLNPDLVIGFSDIQANLAKDLISLGLNVLITNQRSIAEILNSMFLIGTIVGKEKEVTSLINDWKINLQTYEEESRNQTQRPKVFFQEWDDPIISGIQWVSEAIQLAGGEDVFPKLGEEKAAKDRIITAKSVADTNPDGIIGCWCGKPMDWDWVRNHPEWQSTTAVQKDTIFEMDPSIILQPGPALFTDGIPKLREIISEIRSKLYP
ncbi:ABC transporter substrate binding protein [Leptospira ryugenii]|uniref:ABC transporter substrate binding protein n=1 Tax=Leptospira ryugenii TaxID=1917863 RepID=A0A2P2E2W2_9LEPT|nr:cobalamin-binding protein [Leptospira ryugenii]GBF51194.1 ABC transporter substrate binding protein [Leptospira ryugenii]